MIDFTELQEKIRKQEDEFYLIISGDKEFKASNYYTVVMNGKVTPVSGEEMLKIVLDKITGDIKDKGYKAVYITGDNSGVDSMAEDYINNKGDDIIVFQAKWEDLGNKAGYDRNEEMFFYIGTRKHRKAVLFWNGENPYTLNLIYQAYLFGTNVIVFDYVRRVWLSKEDIKSIQLAEHKKQQSYKKS